MKKTVYTMLLLLIITTNKSKDWNKFEQDIQQKAGLPAIQRCQPIHDAAMKGDTALLQKLLSEGADINQIGCFWKMTPLQVVLFENISPQITKTVVPWLLEHGAATALEYKDPDFERTALHYAAMKGHITAITDLIKKGANKNATDGEGNTALHLAALFNQPASVRALLSNDADINAQQRTETIPLDKDPLPKPIHSAAFKGNDRAIEVFLEFKQDINTPDALGATPLHYAAMQMNTVTATMLISRGAKKDIKDKFGKTPLGYASASVASAYPNMTPEEVQRVPIIIILRY